MFGIMVQNWDLLNFHLWTKKMGEKVVSSTFYNFICIQPDAETCSRLISNISYKRNHMNWSANLLIPCNQISNECILRISVKWTYVKYFMLARVSSSEQWYLCNNFFPALINFKQFSYFYKLYSITSISFYLELNLSFRHNSVVKRIFKCTCSGYTASFPSLTLR